MDLNEFKAFTEAAELTVRPYKRIVWALIGILAGFILLFGGTFYYFMYKAFNTDGGSYVVQDVRDSTNSTNING